MKTKSGIIIIILLTGLIIGAAQPAMLYASAEGGDPSNLWDPFVNKTPFSGGTKLQGTLTMIYNTSFLYNYLSSLCSTFQTSMLYSVRFTYSNTFYTYTGSTGVCYGIIGTPGSGGQGDVIMAFLKWALADIFQMSAQDIKWNLIKVNNPGIAFDGNSFVTDIVVKVKQP
jgi:hypothetical protein